MNEKILFDNPPLLEALCEFHFVSGEPWDWTIPGLFYQCVESEFPVRQQQNVMQFQMTPTSDGTGSMTQQGIARMQFLREDRSALLQVGPDQLIVNQLQPYRNWDTFKATIENALENYVKSAHPHAIDQISLRYVNRIELPPAPEQIEDYINTYPKVPNDENQTWASWAQHVQIMREDLAAMMTVQSGSRIEAPSEADETGTAQPNNFVMLDITFARLPAEPLPLSSVSNWIETAHEEIETLFLASITTKSRARFGEKETQ